MRNLLAFTLLLASGMVSLRASAVQYFEIKVPGSVYSDAYGVNINNDVVGYYSDTQGRLRGFLLSGGVYTNVDFPGPVHSTFAQGINDSGEIVGYYQNTAIHGFVDLGGVFSTLDFPGATSTSPRGVNNAGDIVGTYVDASHKSHGFLYKGGTWTTVDIAGAGSTAPVGINNLGDIVGVAANGLMSHGFLLDHNGQVSKIDFPGAVKGTTAAFGVNDAGQIVGTYVDPSINKIEGYLLNQGKFTQVRYPGASTTFPHAISNTPIVVGTWFNDLGDGSGFAAR